MNMNNVAKMNIIFFISPLNVRVSRAGPLTFKINLPGLPGVGWIGCSVIFTISSHCSEIFQDLGRVPFLFSSGQSQVFHKILACLVQHR
jgi:hypothetical protein